jgi:modification methylase
MASVRKSKRTETSAFGIGRRESHDSSAFYSRGMFASKQGGEGNAGFYDRGLYRFVSRPSELDQPPLPYALDHAGDTDWCDKVYCQSSEHMDMIPDSSVGLAFTSPPYNVGKEYDSDMSIQDYLGLIRAVAAEVYRVLKPGGRYVINVANLGRKPYIPVHAWFYDIHTDVGFLPMGEVIWEKAKAAGGNCAWGSWRSARSPRLRDIHEYLLVFAKESYSRLEPGESEVGKDEFLKSTLSIWSIPPESAIRTGHPAPFPIPLAERVIRLYSFVGDVVLDPFVGSGTTCVASVRLDRHYVGFDISEEYCQDARTEIAEEIERSALGEPTGDKKGRVTAMARAKTETSELATGFGILGMADLLVLGDAEREEKFEGTLSRVKYTRFASEYINEKNASVYQKMYEVGRLLRAHYAPFNGVETLQWMGPQKQSASTSVPADLLVGNVPISLKAGSSIVRNASPYNLFVTVPQGGPGYDSSENWFLAQDPTGYQSLYQVVLESGLEHLPETVEEFERKATRNLRLDVQKRIETLPEDSAQEFEKRYLSMCREVAARSAQLFNAHLRQSMNSNAKRSVLDEIARTFFRMDSSNYILAGVERGQEFAVLVPSLTLFGKEWKILDVLAEPDLQREQSVVAFTVLYESRSAKQSGTAKFHAEVRWSHGKFKQAPEAKLYKDSRNWDVPFIKSVW